MLDILSLKFRVRLKPIVLHPDEVNASVMTCVYLHDFLRTISDSRNFYTPRGSFSLEDNDENLMAELSPTGAVPRQINQFFSN